MAGEAATSTTQDATTSPPPTGVAALPSLNPSDSPYQPLSLPEVKTPAQHPMGEEEPVQNLGATNKAGAFAYIIDKTLRGAVQGYDQSRLQHAQQANKKLSALSALQQQLGQQYVQAYNEAGSSKPGMTPEQILEDPKVKQLHNQLLAVHQTTLDSIQKYLPQLGTDKKTGKQKDKQNLLQRMFGQEPDESLRAYAEAASKLGPTAFYQVASPQQLAGMYQQRQTAGLTGQNQLTTQQATATRDRVLGIPEKDRSEKDKTDLQSAEDILSPMARPGAAVWKEYASADGKRRDWFDVSKKELIPPEWSATGKESNRAPRQGWALFDGKWGSFNIDPTTNQPTPGTLSFATTPPAYILNTQPQLHGSNTKWTDADGNVHETAITSTSQKTLGPGIVGGGSSLYQMLTGGQGAGGAGGARGEQAAGGTGQAGAGASPTPAATTEGTSPAVSTATPSGAPGKPVSPTGASSVAVKPTSATAVRPSATASASAHPPAAARPGDRVIGYSGSLSYKDKQKAADKAFSISSDLSKESKQALTNASTLIKNPADGPAKMGLVASYLRNVVGAHSATGGGASVRITNNEWQSAIQTRSAWAGLLSHFDTKTAGSDVILTGITLTPKQALDMAKEIQQRAAGSQTEYHNLAIAAAEQKEQDMRAGGLTPPASSASSVPATHSDLDKEILNLMNMK